MERPVADQLAMLMMVGCQVLDKLFDRRRQVRMQRLEGRWIAQNLVPKVGEVNSLNILGGISSIAPNARHGHAMILKPGVEFGILQDAAILLEGLGAPQTPY